MIRCASFVVLILLSVGTVASTQPAAADPERTAGIAVMRAINTAENAVRQQSGKYVELADLIDHAALGRVRANIVVSGNVITHQGSQLRLTLSPDALQYQVMVVPAATCGTAIFSNERGLIYTGKVLDC